MSKDRVSFLLAALASMFRRPLVWECKGCGSVTTEPGDYYAPGDREPCVFDGCLGVAEVRKARIGWT